MRVDSWIHHPEHGRETIIYMVYFIPQRLSVLL